MNFKSFAFIFFVISFIVMSFLLYSWLTVKEYIYKLHDRIEEVHLESIIGYNSEQIIKLGLKSSRLKNKLQELTWAFKRRKRKKLIINAKKIGGGFDVLETYSGSGLFYVSVNDVKPHMDGYKISFSIGNPLNVVFSNPKIILKWNMPYERLPYKYLDNKEARKKRKEEKKKNFKKWKDSFKKLEHVVLGSGFAAGSWTDIEVFLTPANEKEIESIRFYIETPIVSLTKADNSRA